MTLASLVLSGLSFVAVVLIGARSIKLNERSTRAAESSIAESARATEATKQAAVAAEQSSISSERAANATTKSAQTIERMAAMVRADVVLRRIEAVMDTLIEMRELFNIQKALWSSNAAEVETMTSPSVLARLALQRRLEIRLVAIKDVFDNTTNTATLATTSTWDSERLEGAIEEAKQAAAEVADQIKELQLLPPALS